MEAIIGQLVALLVFAVPAYFKIRRDFGAAEGGLSLRDLVLGMDKKLDTLAHRVTVLETLREADQAVQDSGPASPSSRPDATM